MIRDMIYDKLEYVPMKGLPNCLVWCDKPAQEEVAVHQRFVSTWSQIWPNSVEISLNCSNSTAPLCASSQPRPHSTIFILCISAIVLAIDQFHDDFHTWSFSRLPFSRF